MTFITFISTYWKWIAGAGAIIATWWLTSRYKDAVWNNRNNSLELDKQALEIKERARVEAASHSAENKLPEDKPCDPPKSDLPPIVKICLIACFLWLGGCASTVPVLVKPELPSLRIYNAQHIPVTYVLNGNNYCTDKDSFRNAMFNDAEYQRVIKNYNDEISLYNLFHIEYYKTK